MTDPCKSESDRAKEDRDELEQLRRWSRAVPTDPDARLLFVRKLLHCQRSDEAILEIRAVIALFPNHLEARKLLESAHALQISERPLEIESKGTR
jgi:hypothetical protein